MAKDEKRAGEAAEPYDPPRVDPIPTEHGPGSTAAGATGPVDFLPE